MWYDSLSESIFPDLYQFWLFDLTNLRVSLSMLERIQATSVITKFWRKTNITQYKKNKYDTAKE